MRALILMSIGLLAQAPADALIAAQALPDAGQAPLTVVQDSDEREPGPADLDEASEIAEKRYGGRAARAETIDVEGRRVHKIRVLTDDGGVRDVYIDPETGKFLNYDPDTGRIVE